MNLDKFKSQYSGSKLTDTVHVACSVTGCLRIESLKKRSAIVNINRNGEFRCRSCSYTDEGKAKIGAATSYARSEDTKLKMSAAKKAFYKTADGQAFKEKLSRLTATGHAKNKYENAKRQGWYPSTRTGEWMFYGSSYELRLCWLLDRDDSVVNYQTQIGFEWNGRGRCLDFLVSYKNGIQKAIEVKPAGRLSETLFVEQINDSRSHALSKGWEFEVCTEAELGMNYHEIRQWADKMRESIDGINYTEYRMERDRQKAKKHYDQKIATDTVEVYCNFCNETHTPLRLTYEKNIARNGEYICERHGGHLAGKKPGKKKENPYAAEGKKQCNRCNEVKLFGEFGEDKTKSDGRATRCKECRAAVATEKYRNAKENNENR